MDCGCGRVAIRAEPGHCGIGGARGYVVFVYGYVVFVYRRRGLKRLLQKLPLTQGVLLLRLRLQAQGLKRLWQKLPLTQGVLLLEMNLDLRKLPLTKVDLDLRFRGRLIAIPGSRGHMTSGMQSGKERPSDDTLIAVS